MKNKLLLLLLLTLLSLNLIGQEYDIYRVVAYSNDDDYSINVIEIYSVSNTIKVPIERAIYVPNAFSPDGDNTNDVFQVMGRNLGHITIEIYNRWGQMVFEAPHLNEPWDGTFRGKPCPIGTYVYQLKVDDLITQAGTITLVR